MNRSIRRCAGALTIVSGVCAAMPLSAGAEPLPSWNDGAARTAIIDFVTRVTDEDGADYVPAEERVAVFDNDGTLWVEHPMYTQLAFAFERVHTLASDHPEWKTTQPFKAVLEGDMKTLAAGGKKALLEIVAATHAGMTTAEFEKIVSDWIVAAKHPHFDKLYTELVYQPMLEVMQYLRDNDFETFIVSGGGIEFMRPWTNEVYGVPPQQVVGSSIVTEFKMRDGVPVLMRDAKVNFIDDGAGKPVGINSQIGRRPIAAFGNSDGDLEMLQWTTLGADGPRLGMIVHHTDASREFAYDRDATFGHLDKALDAASDAGWVVIDMANDWNQLFPEAP